MKNYWSDIRAFLFFSLIFLVVMLADILVVYLYYRHVQEFISEQPREPRADAGIVFFGDYDETGTSLGPDSEKRAAKAASLYRQGLIRMIVCVGGYDWTYWRSREHPMEQFLERQGIPEKDILHDSLSFNTITNWQEACKIIEERHFDTVVAISAPLHVFRISRMAGSDGVLYSAYEYHPESFPEIWQVFMDVHREFASHFLSLALKDKLRNRIVKIYRTVRFNVDQII